MNEWKGCMKTAEGCMYKKERLQAVTIVQDMTSPESNPQNTPGSKQTPPLNPQISRNHQRHNRCPKTHPHRRLPTLLPITRRAFGRRAPRARKERIEVRKDGGADHRCVAEDTKVSAFVGFAPDGAEDAWEDSEGRTV